MSMAQQHPQAVAGQSRGMPAPQFDHLLLGAALALLGFGLVMVASASLQNHRLPFELMLPLF